jgi:hypothetical protein
MNIKTPYPVIIDNEKLSPSDYYSNAAGTSTPENYTAGDISVTTAYPVVIDGTDVSSKDYYANADGATPSMADQAAAKQKGLFWDRTKGAWSKITNSPGAQFALEKVAEYLKLKQGGGYAGGGGYTGAIPDSTPTPTPTETPQPMSKTAKIILIGGGVLVVGLVLVGIFAKKK